MPAHPMVAQLRFARSEFRRCLEGVSGEDAIRRLEPMNSISWIVGHLANQEHGYWVMAGQDRNIAPGLNRLVGFGRPATTPPLSEMWTTWQTVTASADLFLDSVTSVSLVQHFQRRGKPMPESVGTMLYRNIYQYC